jgi:hypothetical protein
MTRILLFVVAALVVLFLIFTIFSLLKVGLLIFLVGLLALGVFRIGRWTGRGSQRQ